MLNTQESKVTKSFTRAYCRRQADRVKVRPSQAFCRRVDGPSRQVSIVEVDTRGARLVLPFRVMTDEVISVTFTDSLGRYQTRRARVAWTESLGFAGQVMIGLCFEFPLPGGARVSRVA